MADHSVHYFFFFVKRFYPFVNTPARLGLSSVPRRTRPPHPQDEPVTANIPDLAHIPVYGSYFLGDLPLRRDGRT